MPLGATCLYVQGLPLCDSLNNWVTIGLMWERWIWFGERGKKICTMVLLDAMPKSKCFQFLWDGLNDVLPFTWGTPQKSNWTYICWKTAREHEKKHLFAARADFRTIGVSKSIIISRTPWLRIEKCVFLFRRTKSTLAPSTNCLFFSLIAIFYCSFIAP